jgi:hypothetical protein
MWKSTYKCNASKDLMEKSGDVGSFRWTSISFLFSTRPFRMIFCSSDLSAGETGSSTVVSSSGIPPASTPVFGLPLWTGSDFLIEILSTCHYKKKSYFQKCNEYC